MSVTAATLGGPKIASAPSLLNTQPVLAESLAFCFSVFLENVATSLIPRITRFPEQESSVHWNR